MNQSRYKYRFDEKTIAVYRYRTIVIQGNFLTNSDMEDDVLVIPELIADVKKIYVDDPQKTMHCTPHYIKRNLLSDNPAPELLKLKRKVAGAAQTLINHSTRLDEVIKGYEE
jgi:hypothetical protein